ncbi:hypothetical protein Bbelb_258690 [Branchiostoma belcheri]|nr:hypothetical protein Bbelb_258690 [Branchiostoma belcheri]
MAHVPEVKQFRAQHGGTREVAAAFPSFGSEIWHVFGKMESCSSDQSVPGSESGSWARFWQQDGLSFVGQGGWKSPPGTGEVTGGGPAGGKFERSKMSDK